MTNSPSDKHLSELIAKFYNISARNYNSKTYDNVLNIFDELDLEEQKTLLRGAIGVYAATASGLIHNKEVIDHGDANALLDYIRRLKDEKLRVSPEATVAVIDKPKVKHSILDRPAILSIALFGALFATAIGMVAAFGGDDAMLQLSLLTTVMEFMLQK